MKKLWFNTRIFLASLFRGMRNADDIITTSNREIDSGGAEEEQKVESNNVFAQLLRGEVTQEVKDTRYEMYESVRKSKDFKVIGSPDGKVKTVKKNHMLDKTPMKIDEEDGMKVILIQDNKVQIDGQNTSLTNVESLTKVRVEADAKHTFKATHEYPVRHKIETYSRKVVVKATGEENKFKLDFYLSMYPIENDPRAVYIVKELEQLYNSGSRTSDLTDLVTLTFTTDKAYGDDDWKIYDFKIKQYLGIKKFDGNYILSFYASLPDSGIFDVTDEFKDEESVKKFETKAPRKGKKKTVSLSDAVSLTEDSKEEFDIDKAKKLTKKIKKGK